MVQLLTPQLFAQDPQLVLLVGHHLFLPVVKPDGAADDFSVGDEAYTGPGAIFQSNFLGGLTEATETLIAFAAMCLWPQWFPQIAYGFAVLCAITIAMRIGWGWQRFR